MRYLRLSDLEEALHHADLIVVGAGLTGLTVAERVWNRLGKRVVVLDKRGHPGGNAWSHVDEETGIEVHDYGTHIFHTSNGRVWDYVNRFSDFNGYRHTVWTNHRGRRYSLPVNLQTISALAGRSLSPAEARAWVEADRVRPGPGPQSFQEKALSQVGEQLYTAFFEGYTRKQWRTHPRDLPGAVFSRLPVRFDLNQRYFNDTWEGLPLTGYHGLIEGLADWRGVQVALGVDWFEVSHLLNWSETGPSVPVVYTGPLDAFFHWKHGRLGWRTIDLDFATVAVSDFQGAAVINEADADVPYTRTHEFRHLHPERERITIHNERGLLTHHRNQTVIAREYSRAAGQGDEPYYPVNSREDRALLRVYRDEAQKLETVLFAGRLGTYRYLDMHAAIASALSLFENRLEPHFLRGEPLKKRGESGDEE